jgi:uncharacterized protein (TIGR04255 family)
MADIKVVYVNFSYYDSMIKKAPANPNQAQKIKKAANLSNKPLIEAICEIQWQFDGQPLKHGSYTGFETIPPIDPCHRMTLGLFYNQLKDDYPYHEALPTAMLPDEMLGRTVQHRFRVKKDKWPLVQIGPGVLSINDTETYKWDDFKKRAVSAVDNLFQAHPEADKITVTSLSLRYVNAIKMDYLKEDIYAFLKTKMGITLDLPTQLFREVNGAEISPFPVSFTWQSSYRSNTPEGNVTVGFATGQKDGTDPAIIWEIQVQSLQSQIPNKTNKDFGKWIDSAHNITDDWFFKLIQGDLYEVFQ